MKKFFYKSFFLFRHSFSKYVKGQNLMFRLQGMRIGKGTFLAKSYVTWAHKVSIGKNCKIEHNVYFHYDGIYSKGYSINIGDNVFIGSGCEFNVKQLVVIGDNSLIASGCRFIDHDHGMEIGFLPMNKQKGIEKKILIGSDVWLGCNVIILKGIEIGQGAVVAAGAVVVKSIPPYEIWGGVPAKKIGERKKTDYS